MEPAPHLVAQEAGAESLWQRAPGWRRLAVAASLLTLAAVALPLLQPAEEEAAPPLELALVQPTPAISLPPLPAAAAAAAPARPISKPLHIPPADATTCGLNAPVSPRSLGGATIVGFFDAQQSQEAFHSRAGMRGGEPSPAYLHNLWVRIHPDGARPGLVRGTVLPAGMRVAIGDHVTFDSAYRDPALPCNFVPSLITANAGPAARPAVTGPGMEVVQ
jgi:hypothetical protein